MAGVFPWNLINVREHFTAITTLEFRLGHRRMALTIGLGARDWGLELKERVPDPCPHVLTGAGHNCSCFQYKWQREFEFRGEFVTRAA